MLRIGHTKRAWERFFRANASVGMAQGYARGVRVCSSTAAGVEAEPRQKRHNWSTPEARRKFLDDVAEKFGVKEAEDWKRVTCAAVVELGGQGLLKRYGKSLLRALQDVYPEQSLSATNCRPGLPSGYWNDAATRREFMEKVARRLGIREASDWKRVGAAGVRKMGGASLLTRFGGSLHRLLTDTHPELGLRAEDCMAKLPRGHWDNPAAVRDLVERVARCHGVETPEDWRRVSYQDFVDAGGATVLRRFGSVGALITHVLNDGQSPEAGGEEAGEGGAVSVAQVRQKAPNGYWDSAEHRRELLDRVAKQHGVRVASDWRHVQHRDVAALGGACMLSHFPSLFEALRQTYPGGFGGEEWDVFSCRKTLPQSHWSNAESIRAFFERVKAKLDIRSKEDWYRVSQEHIRALGGAALLNASTLSQALRVAYPDEDWEDESFRKRLKKSNQWQLVRKATRLFPGMDVKEEYRPPSLARASLASVELDIYIPEAEFALEYQGKHHYLEVPFFGPIEQYQRRDKEKRELCKQAGIRLLEVPYWWDLGLESLAASIHKAFPGLLPAPDDVQETDPELAKLLTEVGRGEHKAIPEDLPGFSASGYQSIGYQAIGTVMPARAAATTTSLKKSLVAPRYDSLDVYWTGSELALRTGRTLDPPTWWTASLPAIELDGCLRSSTESLGCLMRNLFMSEYLEQYEPPSAEVKEARWTSVELVAYDTPHSQLPLAARMKELAKLGQDKHFRVAPHEECGSEEQLQKILDSAVAEGASSVLVRDPAAPYRYTRRGDLRVRKLFSEKVKMLGKSSTQRGLIVETRQGVVQTIRCSKPEFEAAPQPGAVLSVYHFGQWGSGRLKYPYLTGVRLDQDWDTAGAEQ